MEKEWQCKKCSTLLGVEKNSRMYLRYKNAQYIVDGGDYHIIAVCRNCSTMNEKEGIQEASVPNAT